MDIYAGKLGGNPWNVFVLHVPHDSSCQARTRRRLTASDLGRQPTWDELDTEGGKEADKRRQDPLELILPSLFIWDRRLIWLA
jgi:hypothetical protein